MSEFSSYDLAGPDPNPMTIVEVDALKLLVKTQYPDKNPLFIVNIGAERGTSTLAMLEERPDAIIFSIDVAPCPAEFVNAKLAKLDASRIIRLLGRSQEIGQVWPFWCDFIWVDGDHSYAGVVADIRAWLPKLHPGGTIAFHDYFEGEPPPHNPSGAGEAVREAIKEGLFKDYEMIAEVERIRAFAQVRTHPTSPPIGGKG